MTPRDRIRAAFDGEPSDRVPVCHIGFSSEMASALLGREAYVGGGIQKWREVVALWNGPDAHKEYLERSYRDAVDVARACDNDIIRASYWRCNRKPIRKLDENTFVLGDGPEENWRVLRYDPGSEQCRISAYKDDRETTFEQIEAQLSAREKAMADYQPKEESHAFELRATRELGEEYAIRVGGVGLGIPHDRRWYEALVLRPDLVERHLDLQVQQAARNAAFLAKHGFRYLFGGGDFASNEGPMYSPRTFHDLMLPRLQRISDACHKYGAYHLFASDGNLWPVADDLFGRSGVDGYYEIDGRAGMDLRRLRERFPRLTLIGNISSHTVHLGTREDVIAEARAALEEAARSGRIIVGTSNYFVPGTPVDNVLALLETIREHRTLR